jgi:hypothetical protein
MAPDFKRAAMAADLFVATYKGKNSKAAERPAQDLAVLWTFYDVPDNTGAHADYDFDRIDVCYISLSTELLQS